MRLNARLILGSAVPGSVLVAVAAFVGIATSQVADEAINARDAGKISFTAAMEAQELKFHTVEVQQFLTDISATRGQDGLDDGFKDAEEHAQGCRRILAKFEKAAGGRPQELAQLAEISTAFEAYYREAMAMAKAYVTEGTTAGNRLMGTVDEQALKLVAAVDPFVARHGLEGQESLDALVIRAGRIRSLVWWVAGIGTVLAIGVGVFLARSIVDPLQRVIGHFGVAAEGDLTRELSRDLTRRGDEIGAFARSVETFVASLRSVIADVSRSAVTLASSSTELAAASTQATADAKQTSDKAATVAASAEQVSTASGTVSEGMAQASRHLNSVVAAAEQMTGTIGEIANHSEKARGISGEATQQARSAMERMSELSEAASAIGKVSETITAISQQTNLLALNATIEAARAGAAGKGFAVVAHEIKELARQTAEATEDIKAQVQGIQSSTAATSRDFQGVSEVIDRIREIVEVIAGAVEEQSHVTKDIAHNVTGAAGDVAEASQRVSTILDSSRSVAADIAAVNEAAGDITSGNELVLDNASRLSTVADQLRSQIGRFKVESGEALV